MLGEDFCVFLEYEITSAFQYSKNENTKGFWCDGVLLSQPDKYYAQKYVNDNRQIVLTAFIGKGGGQEYELTLKFGPKALSRHARNLDIKECVPDPATPDWFSIDLKKKKIVIALH